MPVRNVVKLDLEDSFYHVYNRGVNKKIIFGDNEDYATFLNLLKRYLGNKTQKDPSGRGYPNYYPSLELLAYCLMPNHFHLFFYQSPQGVMQGAIRSICTSYSLYYNKKYRRRGPLFESTYKASHITSDAYLIHISRYIHLNPKQWRKYPYSSLAEYMGERNTSWVHPERILEQFKTPREYLKFVSDYQDYKRSLEQLKYELAD